RPDHQHGAAETYVDEWVRRQRAEAPSRAERFQMMCDLFPFPQDAPATVLDVGAGYGPLSAFILERYPHATCIAQDGSEPMLHRARPLIAQYGERFKTHRSDLFTAGWLPEQFGPFHAALSSSCLHNPRDFARISHIYREIREHLPGRRDFREPRPDHCSARRPPRVLRRREAPPPPPRRRPGRRRRSDDLQ